MSMFGCSSVYQDGKDYARKMMSEWLLDNPIEQKRKLIMKLLEDIPSISSLNTIVNRTLEIHSTCNYCGRQFGIDGYMNMLEHQNSIPCKKQQATNRGDEFKRERKYCTHCDKNVFATNWPQHVQSKAHKRNEQGITYKCTMCNKNYSSKHKPRVELKRHLKSKKHKARCLLVENIPKHNHICDVIEHPELKIPEPTIENGVVTV